MKSGKLKCHHSRPPERLALLLPSASNMPCHSRGRGGEEMQWGWRRRRRRPGEGTKSVVSIAATVDAPIHLEDLSGRNKFTNEIHALHRKCADHPIKVSERCQWANPIPGLFTLEGGVRTHVATFLSFSKKPHRRRDGEGGSPKPPLQMPPSPPNPRPTAVAVLELLAAAIATNPTFPPLPTGRGDLPHSDATATARKDHIFFQEKGEKGFLLFSTRFSSFSSETAMGMLQVVGYFFFLGRRILRAHPPSASLAIPFLALVSSPSLAN